MKILQFIWYLFIRACAGIIVLVSLVMFVGYFPELTIQLLIGALFFALVYLIVTYLWENFESHLEEKKRKKK